jgi:hypothetical protein
MRFLVASAGVALTIVACASGETTGEATGISGSTEVGGGSPTGIGGAGARGGEGGTSSAANGGSGAAGGSGSGGGVVATSCAPGTFVTGFEADGQASCGSIDAAALAAVNAACAIYLGHRDDCGGCGLAPVKWGSTTATACANGVGTNNTCQAPLLGGDTVQLFGLNVDGDVDENDKLYFGMHCPAPTDAPSAGPCAEGSFVTGLAGSEVTCTPAAHAVIAYVRQSCWLYAGQRDSCDGCALGPTRWGRVSSEGCETGVGSGNTCAATVLGGESVQLLGLSTEGNVNDDDKLYAGVRCEDATPAEGTASLACPEGQLLTGVAADGTLSCASPAPQVATWFRASCNLWWGWRDSCNGCNSAPTKWGTTRDGGCANGAGAGNTCSIATLGAQAVQLFGLDTDGDVDDDDKLYAGLACQ